MDICFFVNFTLTSPTIFFLFIGMAQQGENKRNENSFEYSLLFMLTFHHMLFNNLLNVYYAQCCILKRINKFLSALLL